MIKKKFKDSDLNQIDISKLDTNIWLDPFIQPHRDNIDEFNKKMLNDIHERTAKNIQDKLYTESSHIYTPPHTIPSWIYESYQQNVMQDRYNYYKKPYSLPHKYHQWVKKSKNWLWAGVGIVYFVELDLTQWEEDGPITKHLVFYYHSFNNRYSATLGTGTEDEWHNLLHENHDKYSEFLKHMKSLESGFDI